jgi:hypothetical protein
MAQQCKPQLAAAVADSLTAKELILWNHDHLDSLGTTAN